MIFSRRDFGSESIFHSADLEMYQDGFGTPGVDFWLGLDNMHNITNNKIYELKAYVKDVYGNVAEGILTHFRVGVSKNYVLLITYRLSEKLSYF